MLYKDYIELGFKREDLNDKVLFNQTGYSGFILSKDLGNGFSIALCDGEFNTPKLYFENCFIGNLTTQMLHKICKPETPTLC